jgi:DNA polymerase III delta prime subunit
MSISTIIIGNNKEERDRKILDVIDDPKFSLTGNPDLKIIEKPANKKSIGIEEVREIGKYLKILPISHNQKVVLINQANLLTLEAQNSLLKILEEPPEYARIILEAQGEEKFLPTIVSRCQIVHLSNSKESSPNLPNFITMSLDQRFKWSEETAKLEKEEIIKILHLIFQEIKNLDTKPQSKSINILLEVIDNLSKYNLNTRLALEYLSLNFEIIENKL